VWLLIGYPIIVGFYGVENRLRVKSYGRSARRTIPLAVTFLAHAVVALVYVHERRELRASTSANHDLLWLNAATLSVAIAVMWGYRKFNDWYKTNFAFKN